MVSVIDPVHDLDAQIGAGIRRWLVVQVWDDTKAADDLLRRETTVRAGSAGASAIRLRRRLPSRRCLVEQDEGRILFFSSVAVAAYTYNQGDLPV